MILFWTLRSIVKHRDKVCRFLNKTTSIYSVNFKQFSQSFSLNQWGKNKKHRTVKLQWYIDTMADPKVEEILAPLRANVKEQVSKL